MFYFLSGEGQEILLQEKKKSNGNVEKRMLPFEKSKKYGICALEDGELLAAMLRTGVKGQGVMELSAKILNTPKENPGLLGLNYLTEAELRQIDGIGEVKAFQLLCIVELARRMAKEEKKKGLCFNRPETIADYYMQDFRCMTQENLMLLLLNSRNALIKDILLTKGTVNASIADPRDIFIKALKHQAVSIILLHNHPSGNPLPSREDIMLTRRIKEAGEIVGTALTDHIVLGDNCYFSFREKGII